MQDQEYQEYIPLFTDRVTQSLKGEIKLRRWAFQ